MDQLPTPTEALRDAGSAYLIFNTIDNAKHIWIIEGPQNGNLEWVDIGTAGVGVQGPAGKDGVGINNLTYVTDTGTPVVTYNTTEGVNLVGTERYTYQPGGVTHDASYSREIPLIFGNGLTADASVEQDKVTVKANIAKIQAADATEFTPDANGVVTIPIGGDNLGLVALKYHLGIALANIGDDKGNIYLYVVPAENYVISNRDFGYFHTIQPRNLNFAVKAALTDDKRMGTETSGTNTAFTDTEKNRACEVLGASRKLYRHIIWLTNETENKKVYVTINIISSKSTPIDSLTKLFDELYDYRDKWYPCNGRIDKGTDKGIAYNFQPVSWGAIAYLNQSFEEGFYTWTDNSEGLTITDTVTTI